MTRVDFYVSPQHDEEARLQLACRIAEKAYKLSHRVYIHTDDPLTASKIDDMLWTFRQGSFIPHCLNEDENVAHSAILIGHEQPASSEPQVLINLASAVPEFFSRFERIAEIVAGSDETRQSARDRFKYYRERGYPLETHELNS